MDQVGIDVGKLIGAGALSTQGVFRWDARLKFRWPIDEWVSYVEKVVKNKLNII